MDSLLELPWLLRSVSLWVVMLSASACIWFARKTPPGHVRLLATLPVLVAMHCCPLLFDFRKEPVAAMSAAFLCVRLTSGKVFAFILGRGALTLPLSFMQFVTVMLAPFMPAEIAAAKDAPSTSAPATLPAVADATAGSGSAAVPLKSLMDVKLKGLSPLHTVWQRVSPAQRFSLDSNCSRSSSSSSSGNIAAVLGGPSPASSSPLDSPRIAAVHPQQDLHTRHTSRPHTPPAPQQQEQQQEGLAPATTNTAAAPAAVPAGGADAAHANPSSSHSSRRLSCCNLLLNAAVCGAFLVYCCHSTSALRAVCLHIAAMWLMWRAMELLMWGVSRPARTQLGMTLAPHFINPFASTSLTDFWARRWNITQGLVLRFYVYEPIVQGCLVAPTQPTAAAAAPKGSSKSCDALLSQQPPVSTTTDTSTTIGTAAAKPPAGKASLRQRKPSPLSAAASTTTTTTTSSSIKSGADTSGTMLSTSAVLAGHSAAFAPRWRRQLAAAATFVMSGAEHELFLWYLLRTWDYKWLLFFTLQGLLLAVEGRVKQAAKAGGLQLHPFVSHLAVLLLLGVTADLFFWPPLLQPGLVGPLLEAVPAPLAGWLGLRSGI